MEAIFMFKYSMKKIDDNTVVIKTDKGNTVTLRFQPEDNFDVEDIITNNLLTSYERRIKEQIRKI